MDRVPNQPKSLDRHLENQARFQDIKDRASAARPVNAGVDILRGPSRGATDPALRKIGGNLL